jgi:Family of unknown function (DUF6599)
VRWQLRRRQGCLCYRPYVDLMRERFLVFGACVLLLLMAASLRAAEVHWPAKIGPWTVSSTNAATPGSDSVPSALEKESGLVGISSRLYHDGDVRLPLTLFTFHDSTGAYEVYTALRGMAAAMNTNNAVVVKSNVVLWIGGTSNPVSEDLKDVLAWEQSVSDGVASPPVATYLPEKGKEPFTERYALGPIGFQEAAKSLRSADAAALVDHVGFNSGAEAIFARYENGKGAPQATLLLIEYPTPQLAELHLRHMQRAILAAKAGASVERKGSLLSIVLAPTSQEYAEKLRGAVNYETQVTWSEPSSTATDPPITSTLVKIFIATGVFMVLTIVVGIAFGGVRVITKRLFPGKVFDRPHQIEVLQLGLSSKPIDPQDLY